MLVSPLCLGNMMFGSWGNADHDDCVRIIDQALDHGINFVDTADVYSAGESEIITGKALKGAKRDGVVLATKCHFPLEGGPFSTNRVPNTWGNSRRYIMKACDDSLRRLGTDWIDLYQLHRPDPNVPIEESLSALNDLVHMGKIRAFGCLHFSRRTFGGSRVGGRQEQPHSLQHRTAALQHLRAVDRTRPASRRVRS